jgi:hypothetical protein
LNVIPEQRAFCVAKNLSEPRDASRLLRRNNRVLGSLPYYKWETNQEIQNRRRVPHGIWGEDGSGTRPNQVPPK